MARDLSPAPSGRDEVVRAIVETAAELWAERGPDAVSLREVAAGAGVNYGLIHQYVGTKDDLVHLVFRSLSERAAADFAEAADTTSALDRLLGDDTAGSAYVRMLAWALLQGRDAGDLLGPSPALAALTQRVDPGGEDPRLVVAAVTSMVLGWRLFGPFVCRGAGLDGVPGAELDAAVRRVATAIIEPRHAG